MDGIELATTKSDRFLGIARLSLDSLNFKESLQKEHREASEKATTQLLNVFRLEGCKRYLEENFIDALVPQDEFSAALQGTTYTLQSFRDASRHYNPTKICTLDLNVDCINGLHRTKAAKQLLDKNDMWWVVRLYSREDFGERHFADVREAFSHEQKFSDGVIFRNIRENYYKQDEISEKKWWARLTETKRRDLRQLLNSGPLINAFDELLTYPGLWQPIQLGTLHRLHSLRCQEELICYLTHIKRVWSKIMGSCNRKYLDSATVHYLELRSPGTSTFDMEKIQAMIRERILFPQVVVEDDRRALLSSISQVKCLIPSFRTFFENQKFMEPCSLILKALLGPSEKRSLWRGFQANFWRPENIKVQYCENKLATFQRGNLQLVPAYQDCPENYEKRLGYLQLWLFCFRHFPQMTPLTPRLASRREKATIEQNYALWPALGALACKLGFRTDVAELYANKDPDVEQAAQFLSSSRPGSIDQVNYEKCLQNIVCEMKGLSGITEQTGFCKFTRSTRYSLDRRCGRPYNDDHTNDKNFLFAPSLVHEPLPDGEERDITSLYVKRDLIQAFFGDDIFTSLAIPPSRSNGGTEAIFTGVFSSSWKIPDEIHDELLDLKDKLKEASKRISDLEKENKTLDDSIRKSSNSSTLRIGQVLPESESQEEWTPPGDEIFGVGTSQRDLEIEATHYKDSWEYELSRNETLFNRLKNSEDEVTALKESAAAMVHSRNNLQVEKEMLSSELQSLQHQKREFSMSRHMCGTENCLYSKCWETHWNGDLEGLAAQAELSNQVTTKLSLVDTQQTRMVHDIIARDIERKSLPGSVGISLLFLRDGLRSVRYWIPTALRALQTFIDQIRLLYTDLVVLYVKDIKTTTACLTVTEYNSQYWEDLVRTDGSIYLGEKLAMGEFQEHYKRLLKGKRRCRFYQEGEVETPERKRMRTPSEFLDRQ